MVRAVLVPAQVFFIHRKAEKEEAQQLPVLRKSQGLNCWHSVLPFSGCLPLSHLPTALFQSCLSSLQGRPGGLGQLVLLALGEVAWALVHQDWFLHICKVPYSSQTLPPMVKPQVLTVTMRETTACHWPGQIPQQHT